MDGPAIAVRRYPPEFRQPSRTCQRLGVGVTAVRSSCGHSTTRKSQTSGATNTGGVFVVLCVGTTWFTCPSA